MPVLAPAGLGDSLNVTALGGSPAARPRHLPRPVECRSILRESRGSLSRYPQGSSALGHPAVAQAAAESEGPSFKSLSPEQLSLEIDLSSPFSLSLSLVFLPFSLPLVQSGSFSRIPLHLDLLKSPIQLVFSSFSGIWRF